MKKLSQNPELDLLPERENLSQRNGEGIILFLEAEICQGR